MAPVGFNPFNTKYNPVNPINTNWGGTKGVNFGEQQYKQQQPKVQNQRINNNDFEDFKANFLPNCNLNAPAALNNDPNAGIVRRFDLTA